MFISFRNDLQVTQLSFLFYVRQFVFNNISYNIYYLFFDTSIFKLQLLTSKMYKSVYLLVQFVYFLCQFGILLFKILVFLLQCVNIYSNHTSEMFFYPATGKLNTMVQQRQYSNASDGFSGSS
jgi:hypothetical protein